MRRFFAVLILLAVCSVSAVNIGYNISLNQYKQTSHLNNSISLAMQLSSRIRMNANASFSAQRSEDLHRFLDGRNGSAALSYSPADNIELGINLNRTISIEERYGEVQSDHLNNSTSGQIRFSPYDWLSLDISLGAHFVDYMNPSGDSTITGHDQGGIRNADISLNKTLFDGLNSSLQFSEHRTLGEENDSGKDALNCRLNYSFPRMFNGGSINISAGASRMFTTYKDSSNSHRQQSWNYDMSVVVPTPLEFLAIEISTGWDYNKRYWEYVINDPTQIQPVESPAEDVRDRKNQGRDISASLRYQILDDLLLNISISRGINRNDRKRSGTGLDTLFNVYDISDNRKFHATLQYFPNDVRITFERVIQLYCYDSYGTWKDTYGTTYSDESDRDELREVLALSIQIPISGTMTLEGDIQGQNTETIYLKAAQSGNSKESSTYSVSPGFRFTPGGDWTLSESVRFSADYTTFLFPDYSSSGSNLLFRKVESQMAFQRISQDSTTLGVSHRFHFQDQGSYENSIFYRSEESFNSTLTLNMGFHTGNAVGITPSYSWEYSRRNYIASSSPSVIEHMHHVGLRTRMNLSEGFLTMQIRRTFYSRDNRESYWYATVGLNYQF